MDISGIVQLYGRDKIHIAPIKHADVIGMRFRGVDVLPRYSEARNTFGASVKGFEHPDRERLRVHEGKRRLTRDDVAEAYQDLVTHRALLGPTDDILEMPSRNMRCHTSIG
jgi:hypothetical protein